MRNSSFLIFLFHEFLSTICTFFPISSSPSHDTYYSLFFLWLQILLQYTPWLCHFQDMKLQDKLWNKYGESLDERSLTICSGTDYINISYQHIVCPDADTAKVSIYRIYQRQIDLFHEYGSISRYSILIVNAFWIIATLLRI